MSVGTCKCVQLLWLWTGNWSSQLVGKHMLGGENRTPVSMLTVTAFAPVVPTPLPAPAAFTFSHSHTIKIWRVLSNTFDVGIITQGQGVLDHRMFSGTWPFVQKQDQLGTAAPGCG